MPRQDLVLHLGFGCSLGSWSQQCCSCTSCNIQCGSLYLVYRLNSIVVTLTCDSHKQKCLSLPKNLLCKVFNPHGKSARVCDSFVQVNGESSLLAINDK